MREVKRKLTQNFTIMSCLISDRGYLVMNIMHLMVTAKILACSGNLMIQKQIFEYLLTNRKLKKKHKQQ